MDPNLINRDLYKKMFSEMKVDEDLDSIFGRTLKDALKSLNTENNDYLNIACDLCCIDPKSNGGIILQDDKKEDTHRRLSNYIYICNGCRLELEKAIRHPDYDSLICKRAKKMDIDLQKMNALELNTKYSFRDNLLRFFKEIPRECRHNIVILQEKANEDEKQEVLPLEEIEERIRYSCNGCSSKIKFKDIIECPTCRIPIYHSVECMSDHYNVHKKDCSIACLKISYVSTQYEERLKKSKKKEQKEDKKINLVIHPIDIFDISSLSINANSNIKTFIEKDKKNVFYSVEDILQYIFSLPSTSQVYQERTKEFLQGYYNPTIIQDKTQYVLTMGVKNILTLLTCNEKKITNSMTKRRMVIIKNLLSK